MSEMGLALELTFRVPVVPRFVALSPLDPLEQPAAGWTVNERRRRQRHPEEPSINQSTREAEEDRALLKRRRDHEEERRHSSLSSQAATTTAKGEWASEAPSKRLLVLLSLRPLMTGRLRTFSPHCYS